MRKMDDLITIRKLSNGWLITLPISYDEEYDREERVSSTVDNIIEKLLPLVRELFGKKVDPEEPNEKPISDQTVDFKENTKDFHPEIIGQTENQFVFATMGEVIAFLDQKFAFLVLQAEIFTTGRSVEA